METAKQVSVVLENKPGRLANVLRTIERLKVNVTAMSVMDSRDSRVLRLVTNDLDKTRQALREINTSHSEHDVLLIELRNYPGALAHLCERLAGEHVNIDYCYVSSGGRNGKVFGIFKVSNSEKAARALNGVASTGNKKKAAEKRPGRDPRAYAGM